jgi:hypothetical protein
MSDFDWDALPDAKPEFDWDSLPDAESPLDEKTSTLSSLGRGAAQGATMGFADEIAGGFGALSDIVNNPKDYKKIDELYKRNRDESRENFEKAKKDNPITFGAGEIGSGIATMLIPGLNAANSLKTASILGAGMGGVYGIGSSNKSDFPDIALDGLKGVGAGIGAGAAGYGISKAMPIAGKFVGEKLKDLAETRAFKALGGLKKSTDEAIAKGNINKIGRAALDEKIVTPLASKQKMAGRVSQKIEHKMQALKNLIDEARANAGDIKFDTQAAGERIKNQLKEQFSELPEEVLAPRLNQIDVWMKGGPRDISQLQKFKTQMQSFINDKSYWKGNPNASQQDLMSIRKMAKEGIEDIGDQYAQRVGQSGGAIKNTNRELGQFFQMDDILQDRLARDAANQTISLGDKVAATAGAASTGPEGLLLAGANKFAREKGNQIVATGADSVSKFLLQSPVMQKLANTNPAAFKSLANHLTGRFTGGKGPMSAESDQKSPSFVSNPMSDEEIKQGFLQGN